MSSGSEKENENAFSIELKSKEYVKHIALSNDAEEKVLIEGFLGELEDSNFIEGVMLELKGTKGTLRMDLREEELRRLLERSVRKQSQEQ